MLILGYDIIQGVEDNFLAQGKLHICVGGETHQYLSNEIEWFE